jgi:hypothetical protein
MEPPREDVTTAVHRIIVEPRPIRQPSSSTRALRPVPRSLTATLLPGETVTFGSAPHPYVLARPAIWIGVVLVAFAIAWHLVPVRLHPYVDALGAVVALASVVAFSRGLAYYLGFRVVATNRRIFAIRGIVVRRVAPLGNGELAASSLAQGIVGRMFGFGSIEAPHAGKRRALFRDVRDAAELYRECQAVANGVDGDVWTPAVRQTIIP